MRFHLEVELDSSLVMQLVILLVLTMMQ